MARGILAKFPRTPRMLWALALPAALAMGFGLWIVLVSAQTKATVSLDGFTLSCPATVNEGDSPTCTLTNTGNVRKAWPAVGILHLSTDSDRALVRGEPIDVRWGARSPAAALDNGVWWIGQDLVGYSRFDWSDQATPSQARNIPLSIVQDGDYEPAERFYISLAPDNRKGVGALYTNRQAITIAQSDAKSGNADLSSLKVVGNSSNLVTNFSASTVSYSATVGYQVTEVVVTAKTAHKRASVMVDGVPLENGGTSQGVSLAAGATTNVVTTVTAENGAAKTYTVSVARAARPSTVSVAADGFGLECPAAILEGNVLSCSLTRTGENPKSWPVVAIIHSSADANRALITEDSIIASGDPRFKQDLRIADDLSPPAANRNYGYGELFSGGSRTVYTIYGYEKFDWTKSALVGATRTVKIKTTRDGFSEPDEVFYVALAPSGYTGLSQLVDNKAPVVILDRPPLAPPAKPVGFKAEANVDSDTVVLSWTNPDDIEITKWQYTQDGGTTWTDMTGSDKDTVMYRVSGLILGTEYTFQIRAVNGAGNGVASDGVPATPGAGLALQVTELVTGLAIPWDLAFTPDGTMLFTQRSVGIKSLVGGAVRDVTANLTDLHARGETGLMGIVVDPNFSSNRRFYTCQGHKAGQNGSETYEIQVIAWTISQAHTTATRVNDPLVGGIPIGRDGSHGGCRLRFGPDGYLWIATGDAGMESVPQDLTSLGGKVLRVDPNTGAGAPDNPFSSNANSNAKLVYTYGHRNPQGLALRPGTKQMWMVEHGPTEDDEINLLESGGNYGWHPGFNYYEEVPMTNLTKSPDAVVAKWSSGSPTPGASGAIFLEADHWDVWEGRLAVPTLANNNLFLFRFAGNGALAGEKFSVPKLHGTYGRLRTAMMDPEGALYVTTSNSPDRPDRILRVTPASAPEFPGSFPAITVAENTTGTSIGDSVAATDFNRDPLDYSLTGAGSENFTIDDGSGQISVVDSAVLDYETKTSYAITVSVTDGKDANGKAETTATTDDSIEVTINVTDVAEAPLAPSLTSVTAASATSLRVTWTPPDNTGRPELNSYTVQWKSGNQQFDAARQAIVPATATAMTITNLVDTASRVRVRASNAEGDGNWSEPGGITLKPKVSLTLTPDSITESGSGNSATVTASLDRAVVGATQVTVAAAAVNPAVAGDFTLSQNKVLTIAATATASTGAVTITAVDNDLDAANKTVRVSATVDNAAVDAPDSVTLTIIDDDTANTQPSFDDGATASRGVPENSAGGTNVGAALAVTNTEGDTLTFALSGAGHEDFAIDGSGQIKVAEVGDLDHETTPSYTLTASVHDGKNAAGVADPSVDDTITVTVSVTDMAEPPGKMAAPTVSEATVGGFMVNWTAPDNTGPTIDGYDVQYREGDSGSWSDGPQDQTGTSASVTGLKAATSYQTRVRAGNAEGDGDWSEPGGGTTQQADQVAPTVLELNIVSTPAAHDSYGLGETITMEVTFSEPVSVTGTPCLLINVGDLRRPAAYASGSGTDRLRFSYTVAAGDRDRRGVAVWDYDATSWPLRLSCSEEDTPGTIRDDADNDADLRHPWFWGEESKHMVGGPEVIPDDRTRPAITGMQVVSTPESGDTYRDGETIEIQVTFSEPVVAVKGPRMGIWIGNHRKELTYREGTGTDRLTFGYRVRPADRDTQGISVVGANLPLYEDLDLPAITDSADNFADPAHEALPTQPGHKVAGSASDSTPPTVKEVKVFSAPGTYLPGDELVFRVVFTEPVQVVGDPFLNVTVGRQQRQATYLRLNANNSISFASFSAVMSFSYTVQEGDAGVVAVAENGLQLPPGSEENLSGCITHCVGHSVRDLSTNDAVITHAGATMPGHQVPAAYIVGRELSISSTPAEGDTYRAGETITISAQFNTNVTVTGKPSIPLVVDPNPAAHPSAQYGGGSGTNTLTFDYVVASGITAQHGIATAASSWVCCIVLDGDDAIKDSDGNAAHLAHDGLSPQSEHKVDGGE